MAPWLLALSLLSAPPPDELPDYNAGDGAAKARPKGDPKSTGDKADTADPKKGGDDAPKPKGRAAPVWSPAELRTYFIQTDQAQGARTVEEKDSYLADVAGAAYRVPRLPNEATEAYAKRVVRRRDADHPNVKKGQWNLALLRFFYDDASKRADAISRFERDRKERAFFEDRARVAKQTADVIAKMIEVSVEGMEGFMSPLPTAEGEQPDPHGVQAEVKNGAVVVQNIERIKFQNDAPPDNATRTAKGSLRELFSAEKEYNVSANMLGMYESEWRKNQGNLRVVVPGAAPAIYLNELALAGIEAEMHTLHLMCMTQKGELRELRVSLGKGRSPPAKGKSKALVKEPVEVSCPSALTVQKCADRIVEAKKEGPVFFTVK